MQCAATVLWVACLIALLLPVLCYFCIASPVLFPVPRRSIAMLLAQPRAAASFLDRYKYVPHSMGPQRPCPHRRGRRLQASSSSHDAGVTQGQQQQVIGVDPSPPITAKKAPAGPPVPLLAIAAIAAAVVVAAFKRFGRRWGSCVRMA